jgi:DNA polymerase-3 subunit epsilon
MFGRLFGRSASDVKTPATEPLRWVVLDTETTGLDLWRDKLISIAATAIYLEPGLMQARIQVQDSFEAVIRQDKPKHTKENILIHHIGIAAQSNGDEQAGVLAQFATWIADAPLFAFHAPFDQSMVLSAFKKSGLPAPKNPWVDVAPLVAEVRRDRHPVALDERLSQFGLACFARHQAAADTFVTAELLLRILPALRLKAKTYAELEKLALDHAMQ